MTNKRFPPLSFVCLFVRQSDMGGRGEILFGEEGSGSEKGG